MYSLDPFRLLVVANETVEGEALRRAIVRLAANRPAEVVVVAPALNGRVRYWLSDEDGARGRAAERLVHSLERLRTAGVRARGWIGDADPMQAIDDALSRVDADELLIATHPEGRSSWLERDLIVRAVERFGLPTAHLVVDLARERAPQPARELAAA